MVQIISYPHHSHPQSQNLPSSLVFTMNLSESPKIIQDIGTIFLQDIVEIVTVTFSLGLLSLFLSQ